jgi:hypothetical protein
VTSGDHVGQHQSQSGGLGIVLSIKRQLKLPALDLRDATAVVQSLDDGIVVTSGNLIMDGREEVGPGLDCGVVFQGQALIPWMSVIDDVKFAVSSRWPDWSKQKIKTQAPYKTY